MGFILLLFKVRKLKVIEHWKYFLGIKRETPYLSELDFLKSLVHEIDF